MINAFIFDLDGTLVQTEILKAHSYATAALDLKPRNIKKHDVIEEYKKLVGRSREEVAKSLLEEFALTEESENRMLEFNVAEPWRAFVQIRLKYYYNYLATSRILKEVECPYAISLLKKVRSRNFKTALATTSHSDEATRVLDTLGIRNLFDFIATRDLIEKSKPDPEIYTLVLSELKIKPSDCIVIEDSPTGIKAAVSAGTNCIAVPNDYTMEDVNKSNLLERKWIVNDIKNLDSVVEDMILANS
jgi:HAD superfamily hydrolase (TIGR01509 family)